jgi:guanylate kinase
MKKCVILVGPSAVGKTTIAHAMLEAGDKYELVRSVTTREMRDDSFGSEYIYISREEFLHQIETQGVLEHTEYAGQLYGTPRSEIDRITGEGRVPLLILDLNGANSLFKAEGIAPCTLYLYDDLDIMEERLKARYISDNTSEADRRRFDSRTKQNIIDFSNMEEYEPFIYGFVRNCSSVECCATKIDEIYDLFALDTAKNAEEAKAVAKSLADSAKAKMQI